jgi:hypothetical protein
MTKKRPSLDAQEAAGLFRKTEPDPNIEVKLKQPNPVSVKLTADELARLDAIADELRIKRHALMRYAILYFLSQYDSGAIPFEQETKKTLKGL